jgi:hypothetical protein
MLSVAHAFSEIFLRLVNYPRKYLLNFATLQTLINQAYYKYLKERTWVEVTKFCRRISEHIDVLLRENNFHKVEFSEFSEGPF